MTDLPRSTIEQLGFVRYLFGVADQQSRQPDPLGSVAILALHDCVELFLGLAAEHVNAAIRPKDQLNFLEYFDRIGNAPNPKQLVHRAAMKRLNAARVGLKHQAVRPATADVAQLRDLVAAFFESNTPLVFGVGWDDVSLVDLVTFAGARESLKEAEGKLAEGDTAAAMVAIAIAFRRVVDDYEAEARKAYGRSPFVFIDSFDFDSSFFRHGTSGRVALLPRGQGEFEDKLVRSLEALARGMKILSLGLDYRRYAKFRRLTPSDASLPRSGSGPTSIPPEQTGRRWPPVIDDCRFCFDFVLETALHLQGVLFEPSS